MITETAYLCGAIFCCRFFSPPILPLFILSVRRKGDLKRGKIDEAKEQKRRSRQSWGAKKLSKIMYSKLGILNLCNFRHHITHVEYSIV